MKTVPIQREDLSFWVETPDAAPCPALQGEAQADVAIVGGGFAGLSAAYHLHKAHPELRVVLLEAFGVGSGASGRNTGMLSPRVGGTILHLCHRFGETEARRLYQLSICAVNQVQALIHTEGLACDLENAPQIKVARTAQQALILKNEARMLEKLGFTTFYWEGDKISEMAPAPYRAGLCYPQSAQLNPVRLCRELKRIILARGVQVYEQTPVVVFDKPDRSAKTAWRLTTPNGTVTTDQVILATNAYTPQLGVLRGQLTPLQTHVIVTERLTTAQLDSLGWPGRECFFEAERLFNYYRLTPDNRIMFGGGRPLYAPARHDRLAGATDVADPSIWHGLQQAFYARFPSLAQVEFTHQWAGSIAMTLDELPVVGELPRQSGLYFAGGWNGHGVALATASGATVTDLVLKRLSGGKQAPWLRNRAPGLPPDPLRAFGLNAYLSGLQLVDRVGALRDCIG